MEQLLQEVTHRKTLLLLTMAERSKRSKVCLHFTRANADNTHWHKYKKDFSVYSEKLQLNKGEKY